MKQASVFVVVFLLISSQAMAIKTSQKKIPNCQLSYVTKSDLSNFRVKGTPIRSLSHSVNEVLKKSFDFVNKLDHYTLGIASAVTLSGLLNTNASLENIKPNAWNEVTLSGALVYRDTPFSLLPVKAAKMDIEFEKKKETLVTGTKGEYSGYFYKWVPYTRFRLFPTPTIEFNQRIIKTLDAPFKINVRSGVCKGSTTITKLPLEPITFILSPLKK